MAEKMNFLPEQKKAIELRDRNILVSASAGAGKTAVLTERIISILLDEKNPVDIDRIVVVTFTRAAASEMRSRVGKKLSDRLKEESGDRASHIRKQIALLPHAQITTIDSFCLYILRNYFYMIALDPAFRIADENDNRVMMGEVCDSVLEDRYSENSDSFTDMVEHIVTGKDDKILNDIILKMYDVSSSHPWPDDWLDSCRKAFDKCSDDEFDNMGWLVKSGLMEHVGYICAEEADRIKEACVICAPDNIIRRCAQCRDASSDSGMAQIYEFMVNEAEELEKLLRCNTYTEYYSALNKLEFKQFPRKRLEREYLDIKDEVMALRNKVKKNINGVISSYFGKPLNITIDELYEYHGAMNELIDITQEFRRRFAQKKRELAVIDFNDVEHMALDILLERGEDGSIDRSIAAVEMMGRYEYIMVDEYQDSNEVQETILNAISRQGGTDNNMFMVGDVKQSIYQFRLAKPDIFERKRRTYTDEDSDCQRIIFGRNFRSSATILSAVNYIFSHIMDERIGGVTYDREHMFVTERQCGCDAEEKTAGDMPVEVIYITEPESGKESGAEPVDSGFSDYGKRELEAAAIASRIREITDEESGMMLYDKKIGCDRRVKYGDIVILLRSMSGWAEEFVETLTANGIPAFAEEKSGYFSSYEIQIVLSMLKIIDNPKQDIPLVSALKSVYAGMDENELAKIRLCGGGCMYDALLCAQEEFKDGKTAHKIKSFLGILSEFRAKAPYMKVYELIEELILTKDFGFHMKAMPAGDRRYGNLRMLTDKAIAYEKTGRGGIFGFLQSIERLKKADIDFGEAEKENGGLGAVSIMSIHKSKGLEFPVVIAAGMGKGFNLTDINSRFPVHSDIGPAPDIYDYNKRTRKKTLIKKAVGQKMLRDSIGEELRVLYVALTRPENKLIITGYVKDIDSFLKDCATNGNSYSAMTSVKSTYLSFITPALMKHGDWGHNNDDGAGVMFDIKIMTSDDIILDEGIRAAGMLERRNSLAKLSGEASQDEKVLNIADLLDEQKNYRYPFENESAFAIKVSVSEIKRRDEVHEDGDSVAASWASSEEPEYIPGFARTADDVQMSGAGRGTMYHSIMQYIDLENTRDRGDVLNQIEELVAKGILGAEALGNNIIRIDSILRFCESDIAYRMRKAAKSGGLYREQPFVMGVPAEMIYPESGSSETIIVQGIIDVFFEEDGEIVLLDYKTDSLPYGGGEKLAERYNAQMGCYAMAVEKATGKHVKEAVFYSFSLGKTVNADIKSYECYSACSARNSMYADH